MTEAGFIEDQRYIGFAVDDAVKIGQHRSDDLTLAIAVEGRGINLTDGVIIGVIEPSTQPPSVLLAKLANGFKISRIIRLSGPARQPYIK